MERAGGPRLSAAHRGRREVAVEGVLQEGSFNDVAGLVAALWRSAARFGGEGELVFRGEGIDLEDRVILNGRSSRFVTKHKKPKINAKTTPEEAQETVWLHVMNDQMTAARRVVGEYLAAGCPIVPKVAFEFLSAFEGSVEKAGPVVDAIAGAIEAEIAKGEARTWRDAPMDEGNALRAFKNAYLDKLLWTMNEMGREAACRTLFERWREGAGPVTLSNYARYFYALIKLRERAPVASALESFDALWAQIRPTALASGAAGAIFVNAAGAAAIIEDRARVLELVKLAIEHGYPVAKIARDPDLARYKADAAFTALLAGPPAEQS